MANHIRGYWYWYRYLDPSELRFKIAIKTDRIRKIPVRKFTVDDASMTSYRSFYFKVFIGDWQRSPELQVCLSILNNRGYLKPHFGMRVRGMGT